MIGLMALLLKDKSPKPITDRGFPSGSARAGLGRTLEHITWKS